MATEKILNTRIVLKNDTLAAWNSSSIILKKGEIALALVEVNQKDPISGQLVKVPTYLTKVGDGSKTFANLNWTAAMAADVYDWAKKSENDAIEWINSIVEHPTDEDTKYHFSISNGKLLIESEVLYNGENAGGDKVKVAELDFVPPSELTSALASYYTKTEIDTKIGNLNGKSVEIYVDEAIEDSEQTVLGEVNTKLTSYYTKTEVNTKIGDVGTGDVATYVTQNIADAKEAIIGAPTDEKTANTIEGVRKYVDDKTSGIATDASLKALTDRVTQAEKDVDALETHTAVDAGKTVKQYVDGKAAALLGEDTDDETTITIYGAHAAATAAYNDAKDYADGIKGGFLDGTLKAKKAETADKVANKLTVGSKNFDGSAAVTITAADLGLSNALHFVGTSYPSNPVAGDVVLDGGKEYVYDGSKWVELGDESSHALKGVKVTANEGLTGGGTLAADMTIGIAEDGVQGKHIADGVITNAHIASNAAIAHTKISGLGTMATETATNYYTKAQADAAFMDSGEVDAKITALALGTMSKETATDYVKKAEATGYDDILTKTAAASAYKKVQTAVTDPTASGKSLTFIDTISQDAQGKITATKKNVNLDNYKTTQTAVNDPAANGKSLTFIDTISQNTNGVITATKKNVNLDDYAKTADLPTVNDGNVIIAGNNGLTGEVTFSLNGADPEYSGNIGIADAGVTTAKLASKAVTTAKIADMAVGAAQTKAYQATMPTTAAQVTSEEVWVFNCGTATILV